MSVEHPERDARLLPVVSGIIVCYVCIMGASYLLGNFVF